MIKMFKYAWPVFVLAALAACSDSATDASGPAPVDGKKELIAFSQEGSAMTRASLTRTGFTSTTKVVMRIKAEGETATDVRYSQTVATAAPQTTANDECNTGYGLVGTHSHLTYVANHERFWDDAFGRDSKLTVYAVAVPDKNDNTVLADNILNQSGSTVVDANNNPHWYTVTSENTKVSWSVAAVQTAAARSNSDLVYSNNIRNGETTNKGCYRQTYNAGTSSWDKSMELGRMIWKPKTSAATENTGKFDQGHLVFKHALSWITIVLKEGSGFDNTSNADFTWTKNQTAATQNITLKGFPTNGKLDMSTGGWSETVSADITQMEETAGAPAAQTTRTLHAYVLPGTDLVSTAANVVEFEIDNAKYYVTGTQIANAIRSYYQSGGAGYPGAGNPASPYASFSTTEAGKHYFVNLVVSKKGITDITAAILDWETVNSTDAVADNTYATFTFEDRGTPLVATDATKFDLYRAGKTATDYITGTTTPNYDWGTGYTNTYATKSYTSDHWSTSDWFWPNNLTYYHFRAAGTGSSANGHATITTDATNGDYFTVTSGTISGGTYKDYVWGAPFKDIAATAKLTYSTATGFDNTSGTTHQIAQAIGATKSQIKMLLFHVTSQIFVTLKTTTGDDAVSFKTGDNLATVEILNYLPDGKVLMGTGAVSTTSTTRTASASMTSGTWTAKSGTTPEQVTNYSFGIVPQALSWSTPSAGSIGLRITTPDGNIYVINDLSTCTATVSDTNLQNPYTLAAGSSTHYTINTWYPHYQYYYTITLKQTGIANISASVLPWETVTGDIGTIDLEN